MPIFSIRTPAKSIHIITMIEEADYSAAMVNAEDKLKEITDYVSCDSAMGGVGDAIEYFINREADL